MGKWCLNLIQHDWKIWTVHALRIRYASGGKKLNSIATTNTRLSRMSKKLLPRTPSRFHHCFWLRIALLTWVLTAAIDFIMTSCRSICWCWSRNAGMFRQTPKLRRTFTMFNPLSAITDSLRRSLLSNPPASSKSRSGIGPAYNLDANVKAPSGKMPTSSLQVL